MTDPDIVEFFGPPGVGKSTIAAELHQSYETDQITVGQPTYRLAKQVGRWRSHAYKFPRAIAALATMDISIPRGDFRKQPLGTIRASYNWLFIAHLLTSADSESIMVLDQGIFQAVWSYAYMAGNDNYESLVKAGLQCLPSDQEHVIVAVRAPDDVIADRLATRSNGAEPSELSQGQQNLASGIHLCDKIITVLKSVIQEYSNVSLLQIENGEHMTPKQCAQQIRKRIPEVHDD